MYTVTDFPLERVSEGAGVSPELQEGRVQEGEGEKANREEWWGYEGEGEGLCGRLVGKEEENNGREVGGNRLEDKQCGVIALG